MTEILLLLDYKKTFGSKKFAKPYRSGFDKEKLRQYFLEYGILVKFQQFAQIDFRSEVYKNKLILYTSSEDIGDYYKSYIEDIVLGLELQGAKLIPSYKFLRAHNNKVFMEILRDYLLNDLKPSLNTSYFGTFEECLNNFNIANEKYVIKKASGAMSKNVFLANRNKFNSFIKKISRNRMYFHELWDIGRLIKHKGYIRESKYRNKFIVQDFIPELTNDWKILIFGKKYYVLRRNIRKNDFRASGSGLFSFEERVLEDLLNFSKTIYYKLNVPHLSIDVAKSEDGFYLIEFQTLYFGTTTIELAPFYYIEKSEGWNKVIKKSSVEKEYVKSLFQYLVRHKLV